MRNEHAMADRMKTRTLGLARRILAAPSAHSVPSVMVFSDINVRLLAGFSFPIELWSGPA